MSEGFVIGDSGISEFGKIQSSKSNPQDIKVRSTLSFEVYSGCGYGPTDGYRDRNGGDFINGRLPELINLKPGYFLRNFIGFGRSDCKIYIAQDSNSDLRFIREYVTNNKDIIDINVTNITNMSLLGTPLPGSTPYDNVVWIIGDINDSAIGLLIVMDQYGNEFISKIVYLGTKKQYVIDVSSHNINYPHSDWFSGYMAFDDVDGDVKLYNNSFGSKVLRFTESGLSLIDIFGRTFLKPISFYTSQSFTPVVSPFMDRFTDRIPEITTLYDNNYNVDISKYIKGRHNFNINKLNGNLSLRSRVDVLDYETSNINNNVQCRFIDGYFIINLSNLYDYASTPINNLAIFNLSRLNNLANIDKLRFYIEFDETYDDDFQIPDSQGILLNCIRVGNFSRSNPPLVFTQDITNPNVYYSEINLLTSNIINGNSVYIDTQLVGTTVNMKFKVWSDSIFYGTSHRNYIDHNDATVHPVDLNHDKRISVISGYSSNDIIIPVSTTGSSEPYITVDNELNFKLNPWFNYGPVYCQAMVEMKLIPDLNIWFTYDTYSIFKIGNLEVKAQILDSNYNIALAAINTDTGDIIGTVKNFQINPATPKINIGFGITNFDDDVYYGVMYINGINVGNVDFNVIKNTNDSFKILSRYFGEISNITWSFNTIEPVSTIVDTPEIGDNAFGKITCFVRDFRSGKLKAYVSPSSEGILKDSGLIGYIFDGATTSIDDKINNVPNDLKSGTVGYSENAAFKLITFRDETDPIIKNLVRTPTCENGREGGYVTNIFKRVTVEQIPIFGSEDIVTMADEPLIRESDGIVIETSDYVL